MILIETNRTVVRAFNQAEAGGITRARAKERAGAETGNLN